jgi:hypothetical protein
MSSETEKYTLMWRNTVYCTVLCLYVVFKEK